MQKQTRCLGGHFVTKTQKETMKNGVADKGRRGKLECRRVMLPDSLTAVNSSDNLKRNALLGSFLNTRTTHVHFTIALAFDHKQWKYSVEYFKTMHTILI